MYSGYDCDINCVGSDMVFSWDKYTAVDAAARSVSEDDRAWLAGYCEVNCGSNICRKHHLLVLLRHWAAARGRDNGLVGRERFLAFISDVKGWTGIYGFRPDDSVTPDCSWDLADVLGKERHLLSRVEILFHVIHIEIVGSIV